MAKDIRKFGDILKYRRRRLDLTRYELAKKIGETEGVIKAWETEVRSPIKKQIELLAEALECSTNELLGKDLSRLSPETFEEHNKAKELFEQELRNNFGKNIKQIRLERNVSQTELCIKLGIDRSTLSSWERSIKTPSLKTVIMLADCYGCSLDELVGRKYFSEEPRTKEDMKKLVALAEMFSRKIKEVAERDL